MDPKFEEQIITLKNCFDKKKNTYSIIIYINGLHGNKIMHTYYLWLWHTDQLNNKALIWFSPPHTYNTITNPQQYNLIYLMTIFSYFPLGPLFGIEHAHLHHCLLEIQEKQGLIHCISVHNVPGLWAVVQRLVRCENPVVWDQSVEVVVVKIAPRGVKGLLSSVTRTACLGECLRKLWVHLGQSVLEWRTPCHS